ncbi:hypothetical protein ABPG74_002043 [Tetrahymena malaccensis]
MNQIQESQQTNLKCQRHDQEDIIYIKVNNIRDNEDIMLCLDCVDSLSYFCPKDYMLKKKILDWKSGTIIKNFLSFHNDAIFQNKIQDIMNDNQNKDLTQQIEEFYGTLKTKLGEIVEKAQKEALLLLKQLADFSEKPKKNYSLIINEIKKVLSKNTNQKEKENQMRNLQKKINESKQRQTEKFQNYIDEYEKLLTQFQQIQSSLFSVTLQNLIDQNSFYKKYSQIFPPNNIDLISQLEFEEVLQQINQNQTVINKPPNIRQNRQQDIQIIQQNNRNQMNVDSFQYQNNVMKRQNNQIEFIIENSLQNKQVYLKNSLNKNSEYSFKFKIGITFDFIHINLPNHQLNNLNEKKTGKFQIELFNQNKLFILDIDLNEFIQNSQNQNNSEQNQQGINMQNYNNQITN